MLVILYVVLKGMVNIKAIYEKNDPAHFLVCSKAKKTRFLRETGALRSREPKGTINLIKNNFYKICQMFFSIDRSLSSKHLAL